MRNTLLDRVGGLLRARRRLPEEPRTYRLGSSIRLPWGLGLAGFLIVAIAIGFLVGRIDESEFEVPDAVLRYQEDITNQAAQSVRRSVNEGIDDLVEFTRILEAVTVPPADGGGTGGGEVDPIKVEAALKGLADIHGRYESLYVLGGAGDIVASVGGRPLPAMLQPPPPYEAPGMLPARLHPEGKGVLIQQYSPLLLAAEAATVVGHYDAGFLSFPLEAAAPGEAWVVNNEGRIIGSLEGTTGLVELPREALREAATRSLSGETGVVHTAGSIDRQEIIGFAPVNGPGPGGQLGWVVVTSRSVSGLSLPATRARTQGLLAGLAVGILALLIFGWLYAVVLYPVARLQREAERLAYGDLSKPVEIIRYDEIGLIARAMERLRILMIRKHAQPGLEGSTESERGRSLASKRGRSLKSNKES